MKKPLLFNNRTLFSLLVTLSCVASSPALASKSKTVEFNEVVIDSPYKLIQEIIAADVLPSKGKELVTFSVDEHSNRWLMIYKLDHIANQYIVAEKAIVPKAFYRFDLSKQKDEKKQRINLSMKPR